ncbi:MAG: adenosylcobinamide amidohydrolase [Ornithinimicrobium sp.]
MVSTAALAPELLAPTALHRGLLVWRWPEPMTLLASSTVRGGLRECTSLINFGVDLLYRRRDLTAHADEIAAELGLSDDPPALLTAANVHDYGTGEYQGVLAIATVGVTKPTWAADPEGGWNDGGLNRAGWNHAGSNHAGSRYDLPGTINVVAQLPVPLSTAALVGAVITVTEAKTQALIEQGVPGTGTASDAVAIVCPTPHHPEASEEPFAGPRSPWGSRLALAVHAAVLGSLATGRRVREGDREGTGGSEVASDSPGHIS